MRLLYTLLLLAFCTTATQAQRILQLEKRNSTKTIKFRMGDELTYRLAEDDDWYTAFIEDIQPELGIVLLGNRLVEIESIVALRFDRSWPKGLERQFYNFGLGWAVFATLDKFVLDLDALGEEPSWGFVLIPAAAFVVSGFIIGKVFEHKKVKIGKRRRLRLLDMEVVPAKDGA